jgi:ribosomal protein L30E
MENGLAEFFFNKQQINEMCKTTLHLQNSLTEVFNMAKAVFEELQTSNSWKGQSKNMFMLFLHQEVLQYHARLAGCSMPVYDGNSANIATNNDHAFDIAIAIRGLYHNLENFETTEERYIRLKMLG